MAAPELRRAVQPGLSVCHAGCISGPLQIVSVTELRQATAHGVYLRAGCPLQADTWLATALRSTSPWMGVHSSHGESWPPGGTDAPPCCRLPPVTPGAQLCGLRVSQASRAAAPACGRLAPWADWDQGAHVRAPGLHVLFAGKGKKTGRREGSARLAWPHPHGARAGRRHAGPGTRRTRAKESVSAATHSATMLCTQPRSPSPVW